MSDAELDALLTKLRNGRTSGHWAELQSAADAIEQLRAERDAALSKVEAYGMVDHCVCRFEEDGETQKVWCFIHAALRDKAEAFDAIREAMVADGVTLELSAGQFWIFDEGGEVIAVDSDLAEAVAALEKDSTHEQ